MKGGENNIMAGRPLRRLRLALTLNPMVDGKFVSRMALARAQRESRGPESWADKARRGERNLRSANLSGLDLSRTNFAGSDLTGADFTGADLTGTDFSSTNLNNTNFRGANLTGAEFVRPRGSGTNFSGANLSRAHLMEAMLPASDFTGADLYGATIETEDYSLEGSLGADLSDANLVGANLSGATLNGVDLRGADLTRVRFDAKTKLTDILFDGRTRWTKGLQPQASFGAAVEHYTLPAPSTAAFHKWFAGSHVVDEAGNPLVVYHGTSSGGFTSFSLDKVDPHQPGFYFTNNLAFAATYTARPSARLVDPIFGTDTSGVYRVYLRMLRPLIIDAQNHLWNELPPDPRVPPNRRKTYEVADFARSAGYDGVIFLSVRDAGELQKYFRRADNVYVVFSPTQIKSATANVGSFDLNDPDLRHNPKFRRLR
jgi:uncharacterized protein YjbI with pentapeptide repeats